MTESGTIISEADLERIAESDAPLSTKIVRLWGAVQTYYGLPLGERAGELLRHLIGNSEVYIALFQITGFCLGNPEKTDFIRLYRGMNRALILCSEVEA